ncbi:MAG: ribosome small subunit-dependent GTPase A [Spirochaetota bacterium]
MAGINNIYFVYFSGKKLECRIRGKILADSIGDYNPLAPGDLVELEEIDLKQNRGMIIGRLKRENAFRRWNRKRRAPQAVAANIHLLIAVTSPDAPPFRPRFLDRVIITSMKENIPALLVLNKTDLGVGVDVKNRLKSFEEIGVPCILCSALRERGIMELQRVIANKLVALVGQSGVGKSSLLNRLIPGINQRTDAISVKYNRGKHTTPLASLVLCNDKAGIIDTPGIRAIDLFDIGSEELKNYFPDFAPYSTDCEYHGCLHLQEPGCRVISAVESGNIHQDRYESYVRIIEDVVLKKGVYGDG